VGTDDECGIAARPERLVSVSIRRPWRSSSGRLAATTGAGKSKGWESPPSPTASGWDAVQKLINLRPPGASGGTRPTTRPHIFRMNLAALVIPGVITVVCVLVGLMTLHEYCLGEPGDGNDGTVPRCFLNTDAASRALYAAKYGESKEQQVTLSYAKFAAISFYGASLLTTLATLPHNNGPLKLSLIFYHILICLWSTAYYTMDFLGYMPQVRSERDGMIEYSVMRVLAVWPVTSTLMISKVAILCIMTRHLGEVDSGESPSWALTISKTKTIRSSSGASPCAAGYTTPSARATGRPAACATPVTIDRASWTAASRTSRQTRLATRLTSGCERSTASPASSRGEPRCPRSSVRSSDRRAA
jgi:hypothetical protein